MVASNSAGHASLAARIGRGVMSLGVAQIARRLVTIVVTACLARVLLPEQFGLIALASVSVQLVAIFTDTGLAAALVQRKEVGISHFQTAFWFNLAVCTVLCIVGALLAPLVAQIYNEPRLVSLLRAMLLTLPISAFGQIPDALLQRQLSFHALAKIEWWASVVAGLTAVGLAFTGFGVWALVAQALTSSVVAAGSKMAAARWFPVPHFELRVVVPLFSFGVWVMACGLVNYFAMNLQTLLVGRTLGATELGYYVLALNLATLPAAAITGLVSRVMFPALSSVQDNVRSLQNGYLRMLRVVSTSTFPIVVGLAATAPVAIRILYGDMWTPVVPLLRILAVWGLFQAINLSGVVFYAKGRPQTLLLYASASTVVVAFAVLFGSRWGAIGVAWGLVMVSPIVCVGPHLLAAKLIELPWRRLLASVAPALLSAFFMGIAVVLMESTYAERFSFVWSRAVVLALCGAAVYVISLAMIGVWNGHRRRLLSWATGA